MHLSIEDISDICMQLPAVTQDIKWENHLCFCVGDKMFLILGLDNVPTTASFKVSQEDFDELCSIEGFQPAPYLARYKWVHIDDIRRLPAIKWQLYAERAHRLIASKLPKRLQKELNLSIT